MATLTDLAKQGRQPVPDPKIDPCFWILGIGPVHVISFLVRYHFKGQFIMIAKKNGPLAVGWDRRGLVKNINDRVTVFHLDGHEHSWHQREMIIHVTLITIAKIRGSILRPHICFCKQ